MFMPSNSLAGTPTTQRMNQNMSNGVYSGNVVNDNQNSNPSSGGETPSFFLPTPNPKTQNNIPTNSIGMGGGGGLGTPQQSSSRLNQHIHSSSMHTPSGLENSTNNSLLNIPNRSAKLNFPSSSISGENFGTSSGLRNRKGNEKQMKNNYEMQLARTNAGDGHYTDENQMTQNIITPDKTRNCAAIPSVSLFDTQASGTNQNDSRLRRPLQTPGGGSSHLGIDLGEARGLVMAKTPSGKVDSSRQMANILNMNKGVTASIEVMHVESPWVTVFGYPSGAGAAVLRHFQSCGEVHQHRAGPGNWMHISYASKVQASRALAQNGQYIRIGDGQAVVMIGVKACTETDLLSEGTEGSAVGLSSKNYRQASVFDKYRLDQSCAMHRKDIEDLPFVNASGIGF